MRCSTTDLAAGEFILKAERRRSASISAAAAISITVIMQCCCSSPFSSSMILDRQRRPLVSVILRQLERHPLESIQSASAQATLSASFASGLSFSLSLRC
ncbi:unnamed protein product [Musa acuminata subsp. burmannicoides]